MAVKKVAKKESSVVSNLMAGKKCEVCSCTCSGKWATVGWSLLLLGGLGHMLPTQMMPLLSWSMYGVSLQMVVGVLSVVAALYFLLGNE
jgi:dissimilatory sulfite reductase (desulfoviridin) alpha/beta subunit